MTTEEQVPGAGWYDDGTGQTRWWDGAAWTQHVAPEPAVAPSAPEAAAPAPAEPLRPGTPDPRHPLPHEDRAPEAPAQQTFVPDSFLSEQAFVPELAFAGATASSPAGAGGGSSFLHATPEPAGGGVSRFGGVSAPGRAGFAGPEHTPVIVSSGRGKGWLIALLVLTVVGVIALTAFRIFGPDNKPAATASVVAAALESAAPKGELPRGFTPVGDIGGFKLTTSCADGGSCQALQLAAKSTCKRLSALVLFAGPSGNRLGSDVVGARNVKSGKAVTVRAVIPANGATMVRVSSVVCQPF
ncbi:DUF2510 domain-containing protein [Longivirga aurantiaca]|uniref:DUF2510 domain-containing protein n=1 Tax=Longivirga aurantiaca TaxID=1837743 RepID=A0ABW1T555_9ACTN